MLDTRCALSLLNNPAGLERQLVVTEFELNKDQALKPIEWAEAGAAVWLPHWKEAMKESWSTLKTMTLDDLYGMVRCNQRPWARYKIAAWFACCLHRAGWTVESGYGPLLRKGEMEILRIPAKAATDSD